jgi:hypothetical protein
MTRLTLTGNTHIIYGHLFFCYTKIKSGRREYSVTHAHGPAWKRKFKDGLMTRNKFLRATTPGHHIILLYIFNHKILLYIFNLSWFSENNRLNQNFGEIYIWRRGPRRLEFLSPWVTAAGEPPTVGSTGRWGQDLTPWPTASGNPSAVGHSVRTLALWAVAAEPAYIRGHAPAASPHSSLQIFGFQHLRSACEVCFLNLVRFS